MADAPVLRDYQLEAVAALRAAYARGQRFCLAELATGLGKTVIACELVRARGPRALVLAHREELLSQTEAKLIAAGIAPERIGWVMANRDEHDADLVIGSVQTLQHAKRRAKLGNDWRTIFLDEAHHAVAKSYRDILFDLAGPNTLTAAFTATANRDGIAEMFGPPVISYGLLPGIEAGWLADLRAKRIVVEGLTFGTVRKSHGDWRSDDLARALLLADAPGVVAKAYREHAEGRPALVFTPTVELAHACAEELVKAGVKAEAVDGTTDRDIRAAVLERYRSGETMVLGNCALFTEGIDLPMCSCVIIARPTLSPLLYAQMIGRGTRIAPGKTDALILDLAGASKRHRLTELRKADGPEQVGLEDLVGVDCDDGESIGEAARRRAEMAPILALLRRLDMVEIDLLGPHGRPTRAELDARKRAGKWIDLGDDAALLDWGASTRVVVTGNDHGYRTSLVSRTGTVGEGGTFVDRLQALSAGEALAKRFGRRPGDESWRAGRSEPAQWGYVRSLWPSVSGDALRRLDRGSCSDLIGALIARRALQRDRESAA